MPGIRGDWGWNEGREDREEIFDYIAGVVGASRFQLLGRAVAVSDGDRSYAVGAGGFDIEVAVTDHNRGGGIEGLLFEETAEQGCLGVMERSGRVRVQGKKVAVEGEFFEDPHGEIFALRGADEELPARGLETLQHRMNAGIDGVLRPPGGVVTHAVVVHESCAASIVAIRHEAAPGLFRGRTDEPVKRPGPGDAMGFERSGKASENPWFRISERPVEIEYCGPAHHHMIK